MITFLIIAALAGIGVYWKTFGRYEYIHEDRNLQDRNLQDKNLQPRFYINYCYDSDDEAGVISYKVDTLAECKPIMENSKKTMWISINSQ